MWNPFGIRKSKNDLQSVNQNMEVFDNIDDDVDMDQLSVTAQVDTASSGPMSMSTTDYYHDKVYAAVSTNKAIRLQVYRNMARYPEVLDCLEEVADEFCVKDDDGNYALLEINELAKNLSDDKRKEILNEEWAEYFNLFDFKNMGFKYLKTFLIDGELAWENIINPKSPASGIVGIRYLESIQYEFLKDLVTKKNIGLYFEGETDITNLLSESSKDSSNILVKLDENSGSASYASSLLKDNRVALLWSQLTYVNTGDVSYNDNIVYPLIDRSKQAYAQLSLMHDAAVILRVVRAPERLVFNIDVGKLPEKKAKAQVRSFMNSFKSKKIANHDGQIRTTYDPNTMLESYFFWKSGDSEGTSVETLGSSATYGEMDDVEYFLKRLYKTLKVPFTRYQQAENTMERDDTITYEEYSFSKFILRLHAMFEEGLLKGFITHLKLRGLWEQYDMKKRNISVKFTEPSLYSLYQQQKLLQIKMENYDLIGDREEFSKEMIFRDILDWSDEKIVDNNKLLRKEKLEEAIIDYWTTQIEDNGPKDIDSPIEWNVDEPDEDADDDDY